MEKTGAMSHVRTIQVSFLFLDAATMLATRAAQPEWTVTRIEPSRFANLGALHAPKKRMTRTVILRI